MILARLVHCQEIPTVLTSVLMERRKRVASPFPIHHLMVSLENADQNLVRAKSPDGVYRDGWLAHVLRHVERSPGFWGSS
jgi:hypothetical protein